MTAPVRVGLVTCRNLPEPDPDQALLLAALDAAGVDDLGFRFACGGRGVG